MLVSKIFVMGFKMKKTLKQYDLLGYLSLRKIDLQPGHQKFISDILFFYLEIKIMLLAISYFNNRNLKIFDGLVGDQKCQTRASMILDLFDNMEKNSKIFDKDFNSLKDLELKYEKIFMDLDIAKYPRIKKEKIIYSSVYDLFVVHKLFFEPSLNLKFLSLALITNTTKENLFELAKGKLGKEKISKFIDMVKIELSRLSIEYEQQIAYKYSLTSVQIALKQIDKKKYSSGYSSMTAFFPSWIAIADKMRAKKQLFIKKLIVFCHCGGVKKIFFEKYRFQSTKICEMSLQNGDFSIAMIILSYRYKGSFENLKKVLNISDIKDTIIPEKYLFYCKCTQFLEDLDLNSNFLKDGINAVFAQHSQFINDIEIDWLHLGLENSELKKEYEYLKTLPGYSINDMSNFLIVHIYASTVEQELEEQKKLLEKLGKK